jgi:putative endonuclease
MIYTVYILYSRDYNKIYIGYTSNLIERMKSHNFLGHGWTKPFRPWIVIHCEYFEEKKDAIMREKALKSGKGREWIHNELIKNIL